MRPGPKVLDIFKNCDTVPVQAKSVCIFGIGKMGLGQAEQHCTLFVHMSSFLYATLQLIGASLASEEVYQHVFDNFNKFQIPDKQTKLCMEKASAVKMDKSETETYH